MTYRDNFVDFQFNSNYQGNYLQYIVEDLRVTNGQDPNHYTGVGTVKTWTGPNSNNRGDLLFKVGRKGSGEVRDWFKGTIADNQNTFGHAPGDLNFGFRGKLTVGLNGPLLNPLGESFTLPNIVIAQGHALGSNNWWFGGQNCARISGNTVRCTATRIAAPTEVWALVFRRGGAAPDPNTVNLIDVGDPIRLA
ncbi:hypothetical protein BKA70DRAFT_1377999 [Coprinopsis sp. MPI-PUGE-AT-0042]|nr:hypothetical protein BKA70DRAFT_1377999 [Coprinopsis sp. MPI-PUGE-AT-0042]